MNLFTTSIFSEICEHSPVLAVEPERGNVYTCIPMGPCLPPVGDRYYRALCRKRMEMEEVLPCRDRCGADCLCSCQ